MTRFANLLRLNLELLGEHADKIVPGKTYTPREIFETCKEWFQANHDDGIRETIIFVHDIGYALPVFEHKMLMADLVLRLKKDWKFLGESI